MYLLSHDKALLRSYRFHSVYPCCFLALVILSHPSHCKEPCCFRFRQEFLQFLYCASIATLTGSVDALLDAVDMLLKLAPGQLVPSLTLRDKFLLVLGCFPLFHRTDFLPSLQQCLCQRILGITPGVGFLAILPQRALVGTYSFNRPLITRAVLWLLRSTVLFYAPLFGSLAIHRVHFGWE